VDEWECADGGVEMMLRHCRSHAPLDCPPMLASELEVGLASEEALSQHEVVELKLDPFGTRSPVLASAAAVRGCPKKMMSQYPEHVLRAQSLHLVLEFPSSLSLSCLGRFFGFTKCREGSRVLLGRLLTWSERHKKTKHDRTSPCQYRGAES
jgi:hypothetical protein